MNADCYRRQHNRKERECTLCGGTVPSGRRTWCSAECVTEFKLAYDWTYIRSRVLARDRGVCCECGVDTGKIARILKRVKYDSAMAWQELVAFYRELQYPDTWRSWWETDHIVARRDGGTNDLTNLRTLCCACHKRRTSRQRKEWAA